MRIRTILVGILLCVTGVASAFGDELLSTKRENFDAAGVTRCSLDTGAGKLEVHGDRAAKAIEVTAEFRGNPHNKDEAQKILEGLRLTMNVRGGTFYLKTEEPDHWNLWNLGRIHGYIDVTVLLPANLEVNIEDGSGGITVTGMGARVEIEDGSGDITVDGAGDLRIHDGSGGIGVRNVTGSVEIEDGSGSMELEHISGDVRIDDGSGSITVTDVGGRLVVPGSGSGSIHYQGVRGEVRVPERRRR